MSEKVTYRDMEQFLTNELHFKAHDVSGSHTTFRREGTKTIIVLNPWYKVLPKRQLAYVRQMVVQNGLMSKSKFDDELRRLQKLHFQTSPSTTGTFKSNGQPSGNAN